MVDFAARQLSSLVSQEKKPIANKLLSEYIGFKKRSMRYTVDQKKVNIEQMKH